MSNVSVATNFSWGLLFSLLDKELKLDFDLNLLPSARFTEMLISVTYFCFTSKASSRAATVKFLVSPKYFRTSIMFPFKFQTILISVLDWTWQQVSTLHESAFPM